MPLKNWYNSTYNALLIVSVMLFLIAFGTTGDVNIGTTISAYSLLVLSIFMILVLVVNTTLLTETNDMTGFESIMDILRTTGPLFLILGVIGFVLYLLIYYKNDILENRVSNSYYTFSNITTLIVLTQIYLLYTNMKNMKTTNDSFNNPFILSKVVSGGLLIIGLFSLMSSMVLYTILRYYTTDGFTVQK